MALDPSTPPVARATLDIAIWFLDRARADDAPLSFQKLQRLLFLSQSLYAAQHGGPLMPAVFVAEEGGPIEPNVQRLLAGGRPRDAIVEAPTVSIRDFLEMVWQRFAAMTGERINAVVCANAAFTSAFAAAPGSVISLETMAEAVQTTIRAPSDSVRVLRSQRGEVVAVRSWVPATSATHTRNGSKPPR